MPASGLWPALRGGANRISLRAEVPGVFPIEQAGEITAMIEVAVDSVGIADVVGRSLRWRADRQQSQGRALTVRLDPVGGVTVIRIEEHLGHIAGGLFGGLMGGLGGGLGGGMSWAVAMFAGPQFLPIWILAAVGGSYGLARALYKRKLAQHEAHLVEVLGRLHAGVADVILGAR